MPKSLDIFYSDTWIDADRVLLVDKYSDTIQLMPIGITRIIRRTFAGYRIFIDGKYSCDFSTLNDYPHYVDDDVMTYAMYFNVVLKLAKARELRIKDIMLVFRYRRRYE